MNPKFFDVKKEKQDAIINAALKVFAENGYRKASTDVIVKEAGISKGLLFHYFISKQGVYEFIYDYSVKYMMLELTNAVNKKETDFFAIQRMIEACRTRVMKNYPYMQQFLSSSKYESHPDALNVINSSEKSIEDTYNSIYKKVDMSRFPKDVDLKKVINMIGWMSDGYIKDKFLDGTPDLDEMNAEFAGYLDMLRARFYGKSLAEPAPIKEAPVDTSEPVRDDSVMDSMRDDTVSRLADTKAGELSFEERLARGKRPVYEEVSAGPAEEEAAAEPEKEMTEAAKTTEEAVAAPADDAFVSSEEELIKPYTEPVIKASELEPAVPTEKAVEETEEAAASADETEQIDETAEDTAVEDTAEDKSAVEEAASVTKEPAGEESDDGQIVSEAEAETGTEEAAGEAPEDTEEEEDIDLEDAILKATSDVDKEIREVTISVDDFADTFKSIENYTYGDTGRLYAASGGVASYLPDSKVAQFYETSRLSDFTYGSDSRGGRGIPYDSSDNIQIFVEEDDDESDDIDVDGLSDMIMSNTERESAEFERARELSEMGPAPVLPDFSPDKLRRMNDGMNDDDDENSHVYRPVNF